jgi:DNA polymerase-3 subunit epsilon
MEFNLERDIVFFDIEATGLHVLRDRIVQIALIKYLKNGRKPQQLTMMINPGVPISEEAIGVHGITPDMVRSKPTFAQVADTIYDFIGKADLAGYNSDRYDIPMLMEEFSRVGKELDLNVRRTVDVQKIFYKMEPRTLSAAYKLYCGKQIENAHDALADVLATVEVLKGMITRYDGVDYVDGDGYTHEAPIRNDIASISKFTSVSRMVDATQRLKYDHKGNIVFNFGKYTGKLVGEVLSKDKQYYNWILEKEFSAQVKQIVKKLVIDYEKAKKQAK